MACCLPPLRAGLSSLDDFPGPFALVGQGTRWKASHDCDVEECRGVDEVDAFMFMLTLCYISRNHAPLSRVIPWQKLNRQ